MPRPRGLDSIHRTTEQMQRDYDYLIAWESETSDLAAVQTAPPYLQKTRYLIYIISLKQLHNR